MNTVMCPHCNKQVEIDKALEGQIEARILEAERHKHEDVVAKLKAEQASLIEKERSAAADLAKRQLEGEKDLLRKQAEADLELIKKQLAQDAANAQRKDVAEQASLVQRLKDDAEHAKEDNIKMRADLTKLMEELRSERKARENAELEAAKKLASEEGKIREEATKLADERQRLNLAAKEKTITDLQKSLDEAQRKAAQGSQQLQGEIMELDLEKALADAFRDDEIAPVPKGVTGADIAHTVNNARGASCGLILWEIKRTKNWVDGWVPKLKEDVRSAKANVAIIVTEVLPKDMDEDIGQVNGVWVCKPALAIMMGALLRKGLLDVGAQKALAENRGSKADALFNFVTSHEFIQQIESMVETYTEMRQQVTKERVAYERLWALREKQADKLLMSTANVIGGMQGQVGQGSMPRIKGLDLLEEGEQAALL